MKKVGLLLFILLVLSGCGSKNMPNPYINDQYKFSFSYPDNITLDNPMNTNAPLSLDVYAVDAEKNRTHIATIQVREDSKEEYIKIFKSMPNSNISNIKEVTVNNNIWTNINGNFGSLIQNVLLIEKDGMSYNLRFFKSDNYYTRDKNKEIIDDFEKKFLNTFEFIN